VKRPQGFTLAELAVAMLVLSFLTASIVYMAAARTEQRSTEETRRRLESARELLLAFTAANGRLPCPARCSNWPSCDSGTYLSSDEVRDAATGKCEAGGVQDYYGGTLSAGPPTVIGGLLPAATIGFGETDSRGYAVDAWQNRIRYAVAKTRATGSCGVTPPAGTIIFTHAGNLQLYGIACQPDDLLVCKTSAVTPAISPTSCGGASPPANQIMGQSLIVAIVFSIGKNGAIAPDAARTDEAANLDGGGNASPTFVYHAPQPAGAAGGEFDDQFTWITVGELMGRLVSAGRLP
jgi:prepilin-type N-terminal cleavage/methylation domain-containing protein